MRHGRGILSGNLAAFSFIDRYIPSLRGQGVIVFTSVGRLGFAV